MMAIFIVLITFAYLENKLESNKKVCQNKVFCGAEIYHENDKILEFD